MPGERVTQAVQLTKGPGGVTRPDGISISEPFGGALKLPVHRERCHGNILLLFEIYSQHMVEYTSPMQISDGAR
jgi:hypothetical protein